MPLESRDQLWQSGGRVVDSVARSFCFCLMSSDASVARSMDLYIGPPPPPPYLLPPFSPSLISLMVSADVKHHVY